MKRKRVIICWVMALLAGGSIYSYRQARLCSVPKAVWQCMRQPRQMTLYSIHPEEPEAALAGAHLLHGYRVIGQVPVSTRAAQQKVVQAIEDAVLHFPDPAACFNPRLALRISNGSHAFDLIICFECGAIEFFDGDKSIGSTGIGGSPGVLDSILLEAGVPLADR